MQEYPSSLADSEWEILELHLPKNPSGIRERPREYSRRSIINGILYIIRTGGAWRMMPHDLPHWKTCYHYFRLWAKQGYWEKIQHAIRDKARLKAGKKKPRPLRPLTAKAFTQLATPEFVVMMRVRKLQEENDTFW